VTLCRAEHRHLIPAGRRKALYHVRGKPAANIMTGKSARRWCENGNAHRPDVFSGCMSSATPRPSPPWPSMVWVRRWRTPFRLRELGPEGVVDPAEVVNPSVGAWRQTTIVRRPGPPSSLDDDDIGARFCPTPRQAPCHRPRSRGAAPLTRNDEELNSRLAFSPHHSNRHRLRVSR